MLLSSIHLNLLSSGGGCRTLNEKLEKMAPTIEGQHSFWATCLITVCWTHDIGWNVWYQKSTISFVRMQIEYIY